MQKDYHDFTTEDFIADEWFQQWVRESNADAVQFWQDFLRNHPEKRKSIQEAYAFIQQLQFNEHKVTEKQIEASLRRNLERISTLTPDEPVQARKPVVRTLFRWAAAAAVVVVVAFAWLLRPKTVEITLVTGIGEVKTFVLPDSSKVTLNGSSSLKYASNMATGAIREVRLEGEAYFDVQHIEQNGEPARKFIVRNRDLQVEVLGTTFNVKERAGITNVTLNSGKIKIGLEDAPEATLYMQPGDFVQYTEKDRKLLRKKVDAAMYSVWKEEKLELNKMKLSELGLLLKDIYGLECSFGSKELANAEISGSIRLQDEETIIRTLAFVLDIKIRRENDTLYFSKK